MNLAPLPAVLYTAAVPIAAIASAVLAFLSTVGLGNVPGFRQQDGSRNNLMRVLLGVLNVAGLTLYAWTQGIVLVPAQLVTLVATVVLAVGGGHVVYSLIKSGASVPAPPAAPVAVLPPAVPPLPSDPLPVPLGPVHIAPATLTPPSTTNGTSPAQVIATSQTNI